MKTSEPHSDQYHKRIASAMDYIQVNLHRNPDLETVARAAHLSPFHFHRIFKLVVGETVAEFTRRIRLEKAAGIFFYHKNVSVTEVAMELGFSSSQNLAKSFKQHFKLSPSAIRQLSSRDELQSVLGRDRKNGNTQRKNGNAEVSTLPYADSTDQLDTAEDKLKMNVSNFDERNVIYKRLIGVYGSGIQEAFTELHQFARGKGLDIGDPVYLIWDNPEITPQEKCRADACLSLNDSIENVAPYNTQRIPAGKYAHIRTVVRQEKEFDAAWEALFQQVLNSGYMLEDRPCFKILHNESSDPLNGLFDVSFCVAVKAR